MSDNIDSWIGKSLHSLVKAQSLTNENKHFNMGNESEGQMTKRKVAYQNYGTLSLGPNKLGEDRREHYYKTAESLGMPFSAWAVSILDKAALFDPKSKL